MPTFRLRSYELTPPGGYPYTQTEGIARSFRSEPMIEAQAAKVSSFRKANGLPRSSVLEALQDVDAFQCQRLGNNTSWCISSDGAAVALNASAPILAGPCKGCGAPIS